MKKIIYISPHLSTGGLPQFLVKKIELLRNEYDIYLIEYSNISDVYTIQKNRLKELIGDKLITLTDKHKLLNIIDDIGPDIIHFEEIPEYFCDKSISNIIYNKERSYKIFETSHDSSYDINDKIYLPDMFLMVSNWQVEKFRKLDIPTRLIEYPIDIKERNKEESMKKLGLDPNKTHIINIGLFTPRKNQKEIFWYARQLEKYNVEFHFIGNQADNFQDYWGPLLDNAPINCKIWGERNDVDLFYQSSDLLLFTSRGEQGDKETMPLVLREALSWELPILMYNLDVYQNYFNKYDVEYLNFDNISVNLKSVKRNIKRNIKIKAYHLLTVPTDGRERRSIESLSQLSNFGIEYNQIINDPYKELPPSEDCLRPNDIGIEPGMNVLSPGHYGCWLAHSEAIKNIEIEHDTYYLFFECDAIINSEISFFVEKIKESIELCDKYEYEFFNYGINYNVINEYDTHIESDIFWEAQAYLIPYNKMKSVQIKIDFTKWDVWDLWINHYYDKIVKGFFKEPLVLQSKGVSLIDKKNSIEHAWGVPKL